MGAAGRLVVMGKPPMLPVARGGPWLASEAAGREPGGSGCLTAETEVIGCTALQAQQAGRWHLTGLAGSGGSHARDMRATLKCCTAGGALTVQSLTWRAVH